MAIINRIKFDGSSNGNWLLHKYPGEEFVLGSQLIVGEGQIAVFVKGGKALDLFGPGTHTLSTGNIPLLYKLVNLPFGSETPFTAEIYYINTTLNMNLKWGTESPIQVVDPVYRVRVNARANGQYTLRVADYSIFLTQIIGTQSSGTTITFNDVLPSFRGIILSTVDTMLAKYIIERQISVLDIRTKQKELALLCNDEMREQFAAFGMELVQFFVNSINFPDEDMEAINLILQRRAEFEILGDSRYATEKQFEIMGNFSKNNSTSEMANAGIGLGMGLGMMGQIGQAMSNLTSNTMAQSPLNADQASTAGASCTQCNAMNSGAAKFCSECGHPLEQKQVCHQCQAENSPSAKFCNECGTGLGAAHCPNCRKEQPRGAKFCSDCGSTM